jgi:tetratricopeptide (TPR) repeat protein/uncharacterized protein YegL
MFSFQHTKYLFALIGIPLLMGLYFFVTRWKKQTIKKIGDERLVMQLIQGYSPAKFLLKFLLISVAFAIAVIALANPRKPQGSTSVNRSGIDVMIALDVSKSMLADDVKPNRLERAKQLISKLIDKLANDRIGIVVFAGRAYLQMPLTTDHAAAKLYLSSATPDVVPTQGTVIGDALKMSYAAFNSKEKKYRAVVLISDGEDHDETAIKITQAMAGEGVMINTVGIGSPEGATIKDPITGEVKKDAAGNIVITKLNEVELKGIAIEGKGLYQLFTTTDEVAGNINAQLKTMGQRAITENSLVNYQSFFQLFIAIVLLLLVTEFFIGERKLRGAILASIKKQEASLIKKPSILSIFLLLLIPFLSFAQTDNELVKKGNDAYNKKQFAAAAEKYKKATEKNPGNENATYNLGNALYKNNNIDDALIAYDAAIGNNKKPVDKAGAYYNKGVVLQNNKKLPECIEAYKNSLRLNPADEDARLNLQKALLEQKKQEQQNKDQQNKNKKPKDEKEKKDQQPKPQPSKMTKKEAEEKLKALLQQEKNLQDKLRKVDAASPQRPEKDW